MEGERDYGQQQLSSQFSILNFPFPIFLLILLAACASSPVSAPGPLPIPADIAGIVHAGRTNTPEEYALLERLDTSWTLLTFEWNRIEPSKNRWDFDSYDKFVDTANAAGKKIIGIFAYDVSWIHGEGKSGRYIPQDKLHFFLDYVRQTAAHFQGRVDAWCIWNEPNSSIFWKGSMDDFFILTRQTADAVREVDPDVTILGGAFNRGIFGLPKKFICGLFESGAMEKVDAVAFHPYELNPSRTARLYDNFRTLVARYGFADRIWITEVGYPTGGWYPTKVAEKNFPEYIVKTFVNLSVVGAQRILWYQLFDPPIREKSNSEDYFGLVRSRDDYTSKGAEAFRLCAAYLSGTVYRPDLPRRGKLPRPLKAFYFEKPDGTGGTLVLWKEGGAPLQVKLQISGGNAGDGLFTVHDPVSGNASVTPGETVLRIGTVPVFVTWEGSALRSGGEMIIGK